MDPCCGSGHFLVAAFDMLRKTRMEEEGLSSHDAANAVLQENLFGMELDLRCTQIAAFAVALAAWKVGGDPYENQPRVACSGIAVRGGLEEWRRIARGQDSLTHVLDTLYDMFKNAPTLGSLIDPIRVVQRDKLFRMEWQPVSEALSRLRVHDVESAVFANAAVDAAQVATMLGNTYTLIATNVPYLKWGNQVERLRSFISQWHSDAKANLAAVMLDRCLRLCNAGGSVAVVVQQNWIFLGAYREFRRRMLENSTWNVLARMGPGAFETISGEVVNVALMVITDAPPTDDSQFLAIDSSAGRSASEKAAGLRSNEPRKVNQSEQLQNPDSRVVLEARSEGALLSSFADCPRGIVSGDSSFWIRCFWEVGHLSRRWRYQQSTVRETVLYGGREHVIDWSTNGRGMLRPGLGNVAYGKRGVAVAQMGSLPVTMYTGELYDNNCAALVPKDESHFPAIWAFCSSPKFNDAVRNIDSALKVTNASLVKVPFDIDSWQRVAEEAGPLPIPHSDDPTQWLFNGQPRSSTSPLQSAVGRLLGYRWPEQPEDDGLSELSDEDGILCLPPVAGEQPAAERLRTMLSRSFGAKWAPSTLDRLLSDIGSARKDLDAWLRDDFWSQHCRLFHNRPFVWHIWDGNRAGFAALVNYHQLDPRLLEKLAYTYLGAWIALQKSKVASNVAGADRRLADAQTLQRKLAAILDGEAPYDLYVRWKPLREQPIGWDPDLNDGVRLNIRPFVTAGVLRGKFSINWKKDLGSNPSGSEKHRWSEEAQRAADVDKPDGSLRLNDLHLSLAVKRQARERTS